MNTYSQLYWLTRLDEIKDFLQWTGALSLFLFATLFIWHISQEYDARNELILHRDRELRKEKILAIRAERKKTCLLIPLGITLFILSVLSPSKDDAIFIVAGGKTIDFMKSDTSIARIPAQATATISEYLDELYEIEEK